LDFGHSLENDEERMVKPSPQLYDRGHQYMSQV